MSLLAILLILFLGGAAAWASSLLHPRLPRWIALLSVIGAMLPLVTVLGEPIASDGGWLIEYNLNWIPSLGIRFSLALDGLSALLVALTGFLGIVAISAAWNEIDERVGFFYFNLLWTLAGVVGVFTAVDLFLFFFFWEVMLIPMYFIIAIWGHENRRYAATKFFLFTQLSGMLLLISILGLVYSFSLQSGSLSFAYDDLLSVEMSKGVEWWLMLGFFVAFATKLPSVPLHSWLPDAHSQAPTAGSVLLAGVLLKTGAYGLLRFTLPLFPEASAAFAPVALTLAVVSILYCAKVALAQTDIKRLIAYTSVSHMGFVLLGIYAWNLIGMQGAVMTMLAHGLSAAALFSLAGGLQERLHTRELDKMGGLWRSAPNMAVVALFFSVAALGMPGLGNFVGEFLSLLGAFSVSIVATALAALGMILSAVYSLWVMQRVFQGEEISNSDEGIATPLSDLDAREFVIYGLMMAGLVVMGMFPTVFLDYSSAAIERVVSISGSLSDGFGGR
jgi:NADH-quinone oxidoreductase subunit M